MGFCSKIRINNISKMFKLQTWIVKSIHESWCWKTITYLRFSCLKQQSGSSSAISLTTRSIRIQEIQPFGTITKMIRLWGHHKHKVFLAASKSYHMFVRVSNQRLHGLKFQKGYSIFMYCQPNSCRIFFSINL